MTETDNVDQKNNTERSGTEKKHRKRNAGRWTTQRDQLLKRSLYTALTLTTEQIAKMYFPSREYINDHNTESQRYSEGSANQRLYKLLDAGILLNAQYTPLGESKQVTYWYLAQTQYRRQAHAADREGERYPPIPERLTHHFKTTEIYASIKPTLEELFSQLDGYDYPEWQWENESHASREYFFAGKLKKHQPDAEVRMPDGRVFFIERQTKESRESKSVVKEKVVRANNYASYRGYSQEGAKLLFACDTERDKDYVREAMQECAIKAVLGDSNKITKFLLKTAKEIVEEAGKAA